MLSFLFRRLVQSAFVLLVVALLSFIMFRYLGDPVAQLVNEDATYADRLALRNQMGLDEPIWVQFAHFVGRVLQGNFGLSYQMGQPVSRLLADRLPASIELSLVAFGISLVLGIPMGIYASLKPNSFGARAMMILSLVGISLPTFFIGIMLILYFGVELGWLPTFGRGQVVNVLGWPTGLLTVSGLQSIILPAITLGLFQLTFIMRLVRAEMLEILKTDYIKFAKARGLSARKVYFGHALKNTMIPVMTIAGLQLGSIIAFGIITESVFQWPGIGLLFLQAVSTVDIPVISAYLLLVAVIFVTVNLIVDILYFLIDPRLRVNAS
ncbi:ABC transporter permease [Devosia sp. 63-57]|uniref:ABC transporter permease n=1 Tax=Devosia sp. 63-57 TaxID=1895751 RepID=UPI00086E61B2|nr:ABC transporter permease [Devosia sp. 63-57]ODT47723.1 MAG: ABC transporter permease [Pelagibacterium sp. SCN 63-126]ODU88221.1 MAG: ABC transporter permease [Pelagibacterium sp. SCN 63-17]OJX42569.1 MAG: ABC transporter permease [Devosia sp. 63-57]